MDSPEAVYSFWMNPVRWTQLLPFELRLRLCYFLYPYIVVACELEEFTTSATPMMSAINLNGEVFRCFIWEVADLRPELLKYALKHGVSLRWLGQRAVHLDNRILLQWLLDHCPELYFEIGEALTRCMNPTLLRWIRGRAPVDLSLLVVLAAGKGQTEVIRWAHEMCALDSSSGSKRHLEPSIIYDALEAALREGHEETFALILDLFGLPSDTPVSWDTRLNGLDQLVIQATSRGRLGVLLALGIGIPLIPGE